MASSRRWLREPTVPPGGLGDGSDFSHPQIGFEDPVQLFALKGCGAVICGTGVHGIQPIVDFWHTAYHNNRALHCF